MVTAAAVTTGLRGYLAAQPFTGSEVSTKKMRIATVAVDRTADFHVGTGIRYESVERLCQATPSSAAERTASLLIRLGTISMSTTGIRGGSMEDCTSLTHSDWRS